MHAGTFKRVETLDSGPAITCAAGNDDRSRTNSLTVGQLQSEVAGAVRFRTQRAHFIRDRRLGAKLLRLIVGARHQGDAGNPGRNAEIIFDPSRGTGLTAEGAAIQHEDGESFRRSVDRGGKTGGSGSHNDNVIDARRIDGTNQTDTARKLM